MDKINLARLELLIRGQEIPVDLSEEIYILAYKTGLSGELLIKLMFQLKNIFDVDSFTIHVHRMLLLGYSQGQKAYNDVMEGDSEIDPNNKKHVTQ